MKMLQLEFLVSNSYGTKDLALGAWSEKYDDNCSNLFSSTDVSYKVNSTINELIDGGCRIENVKVNFVTISGHNNGGTNSIIEYVNIFYSKSL